jgi:hypothetical protein
MLPVIPQRTLIFMQKLLISSRNHSYHLFKMLSFVCLLTTQYHSCLNTAWGHYTKQEELAENQEYFDQDGLDQLMCEGSSTELFNSYPLNDTLMDPQEEHLEYEVVHSEMHLLQDGLDDNLGHKDSMEGINDLYYVDNFEDNLE